MDISPQRVRTADFKTVKRGLDPDEVRAFLGEVATELERAQNQSTAMEARARAAVARLQELSESSAVAASSAAASSSTTEQVAAVEAPLAGGSGATSANIEPVTVTATVDESETISRTLLLAQRTADTTIAEAQAEADRIAREAGDEASRTIDSTREMSSRLLDEAREEARQVGEDERGSVEAAVNSLVARRDFLESDVDHLERHLVDERSRLREAATTLLDLTERVPGGLGEVRRPLLSASADGEAAGGDLDVTAEPDGVADGSSDSTTRLLPLAGDASDDSSGLFSPGDADTGDEPLLS